jgi:hypothetical protein
MARHSPTGFAFGMLLEIAAVVVIVSLLPRFDLRPKTNASEPSDFRFRQLPTEIEPASALTPVARERLSVPGSFAVDKRPDPPGLLEQTQIPAHEVEARLDLASQRLVNSLGTAAADAASNVLHSASRPTLPPSSTPLSPTSQFGRPLEMSRSLPWPMPSPIAQPETAQRVSPQPRRWVNY